ncbi:dynein axonemal intermediate chain 2 [Carabus blaptoides fortunei]
MDEHIKASVMEAKARQSGARDERRSQTAAERRSQTAAERRSQTAAERRSQTAAERRSQAANRQSARTSVFETRTSLDDTAADTTLGQTTRRFKSLHVRSDLEYSYAKLRGTFGRQTNFVDDDTVDETPPMGKYIRDYIYRNPVEETAQNTAELAESFTNTMGARLNSSAMNHLEGGWPKDINLNDEDQPKRYRRKIEKDESYINTMLHLSKNMEHCILQNTTVNIYQHYFLDLDQIPTVEKSNARTINVYQDLCAMKRPVTHISWSPDNETKLAITHCNMRFQSSAATLQSPLSYIWEIENPNIPYYVMKPKIPLVCTEFSQKDANTLVGGMLSGQVSLWDVRRGNEPVEVTIVEESHRDPVRSVIWLTTKSGTEFFSGSSDGQVKWWDTRKLSEPMETLILDMVKSGEPQQLSRAQGVSCMEYEPTIPTRFMVGTEYGCVFSGNRKGKTPNEKLTAKFNAHLGPVLALQRNPAFVKNFLTVGDFTARIWSEDCKDSSIIWTPHHRAMLNGGCWSPTRYSVFYLIREDGKLDVWDILKQQKQSSLSIKLCEEALRSLSINSTGNLVAVGNERGTTYLVEFTDDLTQVQKNDKMYLTQMFERESHREKILEARLREIRLKQRLRATLRESNLPLDDSGKAKKDAAVAKAAEEEFYRVIERELRPPELEPELPARTQTWGYKSSIDEHSVVEGASTTADLADTNELAERRRDSFCFYIDWSPRYSGHWFQEDRTPKQVSLDHNNVPLFQRVRDTMKDRDVWMLEDVERGSYFSHSEGPLSGLHYLSIKRLDALIFNGKTAGTSGSSLSESEYSEQSQVCESQQVIAKNNRHSVPCEVLDRYYCKSTLNLTGTSEAASLPTLHQLEGGNNNVSSPGTVHRYRRRVGSVSTEDTQARFRNGTANSFRSSGCSKLRRTNACRQVKRDPTPTPDRNVRSRSLNHLDTLGQTYHQQHQVDGEGDNVVLTTDTTTTTTTSRDHSRSEPDCTMTRPHQERLLTVPATDSPVPGTTERTGSGGSDRVRTTTRRQMLSRSQVSSSEYFSVSFELGEDSSVVHGREEFLPATKCTTLGEALSKVCERRSIDISNCDIYIDGCRATTPYILNQETSALGGKTIRIAAKEVNSKKPGTVSNQASIHNRKTTGSYRGKSSGLFFSSSTEDASSGVQSGSTPLLLQDTRPEFDQNKKQSKQRWSGFFGNNKDTRMESLSDILNQYSRHGVPNSAVVDEEAVQALYSLEEDWRQLMDPSDLTERQQQQQTAIWELISTEVAYIKTLKVVTGLFLACLKSVQTCNILTEIDTDKLFSNITEILDCNMAFWADYVLPAVVQMRTNREPVTPLAFYDGFVRMCETYRPYFRYCAEQGRCQHYCRENHAHNEIFTAYLVWCETQKECNRLRLMDILVRPMQRLTKYGLLLKAIIKNTDNDDEKKGLCTMIKSVDDFVNSVNSSLKQKQDNERLRGIMLRIESYDAVETKDDDIQTLVQKHNHLDLSQPMPGCPPDRKRHLLLEGDLKLKDSTTSKMEVHCFLLTDILLICKPSSKKGGALMRVIRPPYLVDRLILQELSRETPSLALVYLNEFKTATAAFILQNNDMKKLKTWAECIRKAQGLYEQAKQTPTLGLMRQLSASVPGDEFLDGDYFDNSLDADTHSLQSLLPARSPLATSSRASRVSSLAHSHSGSVEMNDQSSIGSTNNQSRGVSIENENRTASISSDEGVQPLPADKSPVNQKNSLKQRLLLSTVAPGSRTLTPNTLSVQPYGNLGQSLPNLTLGSPNVGTLHQNTLLVPSTRNNGQHLLSPNQRGISYPPPSPTRANLRRGFAISQSKNPPLIKTGHVNSTIGGAISSTSTSTQAAVTEPTNFDFDVPVISGISPPDDLTDSFNRGQHRQAMMKRVYHRSDNRRYHTAGVVDDIKKNNERDTASILKRLSWNCGPSEQLTTSHQPAAPPPPPPEDHHTDT